MLQIRVLGQFDLRDDDRPIAIPSRPAQSLLAFLLFNSGMPQRRERLAGLIWPDTSDENARRNLRRELWRLRKLIETDKASSRRYFIVDEISIQFDPQSDFWFDAAVLERVQDNATTQDLMDALSLYRGELLPGFYDEWIVLEREHLHAVLERNMSRLLERLQAEKRWSDILEWGERWIALGQSPEPAFRALMTAHAAKGDMAQVAAAYERCIKSLTELGLEPSDQTQALYRDLKAGRGPSEARPVISGKEKRASPPKTNLPSPLTSFVGREREVEEVVGLVSRHRLLTLTGPGGMGKTRLAIQSANRLLSKFKDGVWWVELVGLSDPLLVGQQVAKVMGVHEEPDQPILETLAEHFQSKQALLVLDNCEHLIAACAQLAERLLSDCRNLRILATSREALAVLGEMAWPVPSLSLPGTQQDVRTLDKIESVRLFVERAQVIQPKFGLTEQNAGSVAQVCRRLSGMPLAIELAAARVRLLSVEEIANRLDDRFALLTSGSRTALARHQTLRATIDWSYDLLTQPEQVLFHRLAVFAGGFTLDGLEAVCGFGELDKSTILDLLGRLVGKSLVDVEPTSAASETRYRLLETIREYAREKLAGTGEDSLIQDRHLQFFLDLAEKSEPHSFGEQSVYWRSRIGTELDNIRAAIDWSAKKGESQLILRIAGALADYWFAIAPISEWNNYVETALQQPEGKERTIARAKGLYGLSLMTLVEASSQDWYEGLLEALDIAIKSRDQRLAGRSLLNLGYVTNMQGRYREARDWMERGLAFWQSIGGDTRMERGRILSFYGDVILNEGNIEQARSSYEEAVTLLRQVGDKNALAYPLRRLGQLGWQAGEYERASLQCKESLLLNYETEDSRGVIASIAGFAAIAVAKGEFERAAQLLGAVETLLASNGVRVMPPDKAEYARNLSILQAKLDQKTFARFWARGKLMTYEETVALALEGTS